MKNREWIKGMGSAARVLALGCTVAMADGEVILSDGSGGPINCSTQQCGNRPKPNEFVGTMTAQNCEPDNIPGNQNVVFTQCVEGDLSPTYVVSPIYDANGNEIGVHISDPTDPTGPACIGVTETRSVVGMVELRLSGDDKKAKIYKFIDDPNGIPFPVVGPANAIAAVYVKANLATIVVPTTAAMDSAGLNQALDTALRSQFVVTTGVDTQSAHYWVLHREKATANSIGSVSVRSDDTGLLDTHVELTDTPSAYCGVSY